MRSLFGEARKWLVFYLLSAAVKVEPMHTYQCAAELVDRINEGLNQRGVTRHQAEVQAVKDTQEVRFAAVKARYDDLGLGAVLESGERAWRTGTHVLVEMTAMERLLTLVEEHPTGISDAETAENGA